MRLGSLVFSGWLPGSQRAIMQNGGACVTAEHAAKIGAQACIQSTSLTVLPVTAADLDRKGSSGTEPYSLRSCDEPPPLPRTRSLLAVCALSRAQQAVDRRRTHQAPALFDAMRPSLLLLSQEEEAEKRRMRSLCVPTDAPTRSSRRAPATGARVLELASGSGQHAGRGVELVLLQDFGVRARNPNRVVGASAPG